MRGQRIGRAGAGRVLVTGIRQIDKALAKLPEKLQKKVIRQSMREAIKPVLADARQRAPVETGKLRKAIKIRSMRGRRGAIGIKVTVGQGDFQGQTFYGAFFEYGTSKMAARPFMRPAFDSKGPEAKTRAIMLVRLGCEQQIKALRSGAI